MKMNCTKRIKSAYGSFASYVASHPWKFCVIGFFVNGLLGFGMLNLPHKTLLNNNIEDVYMPKNTPTEKIAQNILKIFPDYSSEAFYFHQMVRKPLYAELIVWRQNKQSIINETLYYQLTALIQEIKNISLTTANGINANYLDVCARRDDKCVVNGEKIVEEICKSKDGKLLIQKLISENTTILENPLLQLAEYKLVNDTIVKATYLKIRFNLRQDTSVNADNSRKWMDRFISHMKTISSHYTTRQIDFTFSHSQSFLEELGNDTYRDIPYFSFVFTVYFVYIGFVMSGGNILSKRVHIGRMGIIVTPVSILGAWGLIMACEVEFTNVIGITPVFIVCHQIINTMTTLSYLSDANDETDRTKHVAYAVRMASLPITLTTFCHVIPFATIAILSKYYAIKLVGIYMVATIMFNYVNHFVFYTGCLAIHEQRIDAGRHCCICTKLRHREELEGRGCCIICCCSGTRPENRTDTESPMEKISRKFMLRFLLTKTAKIIAILSYLVLFAFTILGLLSYKIDTLQKSEILQDSYFNSWNEIERTHFKHKPVIQFVTLHPYGYMNDNADFVQFRHTLEAQPISHPQIELSWKDIYDKSTQTNSISELVLYESVMNNFISSNDAFFNDIHLDHKRCLITATRFYIKAEYVPSAKALVSVQNELFDLVEEFNNLLQDKFKNINQSLLHFSFDGNFVFVHSPDFFLIDFYNQPLIELFIFSGTQLGVLLFLYLLSQPSLSFLILITLTYMSMLSAVFGISYFFGIYLTQVSLIVYMVAGCLCVETIVHVFYSFSQTNGDTNAARMNIVLGNTSKAIFHSLFGMFLGLLVLFVAKSYVFVTVFRLTLLATFVCIVFTILWIPALLSFFGPVNNAFQAESMGIYKTELSFIAFDENKSRVIDGTKNPSFEHNIKSE